MTNSHKRTAADVLKLADDWACSVGSRTGAVQAPSQDITPLRDANVTQTPETRLQAQVVDLDRLFVGLVQRAGQAGDVRAMDFLLRLALRCQAQSTRAVATLADLKAKQRPSVVDIEHVDILD